MSKRRNWLLILFGVFVVIVFIGIGAIIGITAWVQQNVVVQEVTEMTAEEQFASVRARYSSRPPLLDIQNERPVYTGGKLPDPPASPAPVERVHVLVWDSREGNLTSVSIPFWLLRLKSGPIEIGSYATGLDNARVNLRPEELEKYGPGLLLDTTAADGDRVLVWTE